ncbi:Tetrapyrrole biosynthesis [Macleaya cordata]|uniref:Tetrapyrrole biosynthesis n=1 Tax=Macleaya cordata TaxID=56857 RepID=A0A200Q517_MACCD|nr:Tetrapyrrole biosynthesis [Macleaya cordata]
MNRIDELGTFTQIGCNPDRINMIVAEAKHEEEDLMEEIRELMQRLEIVMERFRVLEMEKLMSKLNGGISDEEREKAEMLSREIVNKFLEKPMQYLSCEEVNLEDKVKDLKLVVGIFESSCLGNKKMTGNNNQCLRHLLITHKVYRRASGTAQNLEREGRERLAEKGEEEEEEAEGRAGGLRSSTIFRKDNSAPRPELYNRY